MRILGIDPGTQNMGYGIVEEDNGILSAVAFGVITPNSKDAIEKRLHSLYLKLIEILNIYNPDEVAVEEPFVAGNVRSALSIGRAQAIAILAATNKELPVFRYLPAQIKQQVTNYGASGKQQVAEMVRIQLGLTQKITSSDASDALAVALCHINQSHLSNLISKTIN